MINVKEGVEFSIIAPAGFLILQALKTTSKTLNLDLTITSGTDGAHSGPTDPHHSGEAFDVRCNDLSSSLKTMVLNAVMYDLGFDRFYGFIEAPDTGNEHLHFQRRKGTTFTVEDFLNG
jgi:hypothetical protein